MHLDTNVLTRSPVGIVDEPNNRGQSLKKPRRRSVVEKEIVIIEPWTIVRINACQFFQLLHVKRAKEKPDVMITSPISLDTSCMFTCSSSLTKQTLTPPSIPKAVNISLPLHTIFLALV